MSSVASTLLEEMNRDGFVVLDRHFSAEELAEVDRELTRFFDERTEALKREGDSGISRAGEIVFDSHLAERSDILRGFVTSPKMVALTTALLGPDVDLYWNQIVYKSPETEKQFPWHQDDAYTPVDPSPYLTLWIAVNDATLENGCISVLPGSHTRGLIPHSQTPEGWAGHSLDDPDQGRPVPVAAGSVIAFWSLTLHKSGPNRSEGVRKAYVVQFCKAGTVRAEDRVPVDIQIPVSREGQAVRPHTA
ncbi:MAG: phytanoyl-CoA dioxygenase family protein [Fimbriimonadaceae bacterium]|nr:phytanoyl-CoA dioxygenase family protein [Fimbriimonadaceae bacterium]